MVEIGAPGQKPEHEGRDPRAGRAPRRGIPPAQGVPPAQGIPKGKGKLPGSPGQVPKGAPGQVDKDAPGQLLPNEDNPWAPTDDTQIDDPADRLIPPSQPERPAWEPPVVVEDDPEEDPDEPSATD